MKVVLQFRASPGFRSQIEALMPEGIDVIVVDETDKASFATEMIEAEVLLHVLEPVTHIVMDAAPKLGLIQKIGVGVNTIELEAAKQRGIAVANMPGINSQAVAEHTLALMLATLRQIPIVARAVREGVGWSLDRAAGLDTLAVEPAQADNPLFSLDNVVVTPHIAWLTQETLKRSLVVAFDNCQRLKKDQALLHQITS